MSGYCPTCPRESILLHWPPLFSDGICETCIRSIAEVITVGVFSTAPEHVTKAMMRAVLNVYRQHLSITGEAEIEEAIDYHYPKCRELRQRYIKLGLIPLRLGTC